MKRRRVTAAVVLSGLFAVPATATPAAPEVTGSTTRVSVATGGAQANSASNEPAISADGRYAAFTSEASNLVAGDTNRAPDVFVRDRGSGATTRVSVATSGTQGNSRTDGGVAISADGRYVAFHSNASNLVVGDTNAASDVFVRDRFTGTTTRVSIANDGSQASPGGYEFGSFGSAMSPDGRYFTFRSDATNLVVGDTNFIEDVFVRDRVAGTTTRVNIATDGTQANNESFARAISADGRYVTFDSDASNLVAGDTNDTRDVFVRDRDTSTTTRVNVATDGTQTDSDESYAAGISDDGRYVNFVSFAENLVAGDSNVRPDVFVRDRVSGATTRVSVATDGSQASGSSMGSASSADGRYIAFESDAGNLVAGDTNDDIDEFVHDRVTGATTRVSVATGGAESNRGSAGVGDISDDGRYVAFVSDARNLVAGDTNSQLDVFVRDRLAVVPTTPVGDFNGNGWSDLLARQTSTGSLYLYPGNGVGFAARVRIGTGWNAMSAITRFGDFNRDGREDVIARDRAGALWLYRGTGGGFASRVKIGNYGWSGMREITLAGDLTGDGYPDLLAAETSTGRLYLYPGRGTTLAVRRLIGSGWNALSELTGVGDFNRDGRVDLLARQNATGYLWLYPGASGTLGARTRIGTGWNSMRDLVGVGDFDRDGFTDLLAVRSATSKLFLYPGRGGSLGSALQVGTGWSAGYRPLL